jgi:hypothetical protein
MITISKILGALCALSLAFAFAANGGSFPDPSVPNPVAVFLGREDVMTNGVSMTRYKFDVFNKTDFPADMFAAAPKLPPCGSNTNASRTWVDLYDQNGKRLGGFCALGKPEDLNGIWFALQSDVIPPSWIYIEFTDRQTSTKYKSNLVDTCL